MNSNDLAWGWKPEPPIEAPALWGARLLIQHCHSGGYSDKAVVEVLWDRQDCRAEDSDDRHALVAKLDGKRENVQGFASETSSSERGLALFSRPSGALSALLAYLARGLRSCRIDPAGRETFDVTLRGVRFRGSPNGSHGYVYVVACLENVATCDGCGTGGEHGTKTYPGLCVKCRDEAKDEKRGAQTPRKVRRGT